MAIAPPTTANDATPSIPLAPPLVKPAGPTPPATGPGSAPAAPSLPLASAPPAPTPSAAPAAPSASTAPPAPSASSIPLATSPTSAPYATATPNVPGGPTDYTGQTITPGAGVDRVKLANDVFESSAKASDPYYQKTLRDANSAAGANGQLGSGQLRTSLGDAASNRALQLDTLRSNLMNNATEGTIGDQYKNIGIAQQQQGFQQGQQQTAFSQAEQQAALDEALRSGDFSRAAQLLSIGMSGNPSDTALTLANSYGNQASAAGAGAGSLLNSAVTANAQGQNNALLQQILAGMSGGGGASAGGSSAPPDYTTGLPVASTPSAPDPTTGLPPIGPTPPWQPPPWQYPVYQPPKPADLPLAGAY